MKAGLTVRVAAGVEEAADRPVGRRLRARDVAKPAVSVKSAAVQEILCER